MDREIADALEAAHERSIAHRAKNIPCPVATTELIIYPEERHAIARPEHQCDIEERLVAWFDRYLMR